MASFRSPAAVVLLGATIATFAAPLGAQILPARQYKAGNSVTCMATGDLNRDGLTDVVSGSTSYKNLISVLLQDGAGGFLPAVTYAAAGGSPDVALGDLDGDGLLDVVSAGGGANSLSIRLGDGDGGFGPPSVYEGVINVFSLLVADFDGDGDDDVAATEWYLGDVVILLSDGAGGLVEVGSHPVGGIARSIAAADFDLDGALDLIVAADVGMLRVLLGDGAGGFAPAVVLPSSLAYAVMTGDVDEDGDADVIAHTGIGAILYLGHGDGTFTLASGFSLKGGDPILGDADGDGFLDLISIGPDGILVQLGRPGPDFDAPLAPVPLGQYGYGELALIEVDGDGWPDLVAAGAGYVSYTVTVLRNLGLGVFESFGRAGVASDPRAMALADFDGDLDVDAAIACFGYFGGAGVSVLLNDGTGELVPSSHTSTTLLFDIDDGDVDGDGHVDLLSLSVNGLKLMRGNGSGAFPVVTTLAQPPFSSFVRLADFDGDGDDDAAIATHASSTGAIAMLLADGAGGFAAPVSYPFGAVNPTALAVGDLDLDGDPDLVVSATAADSLAVLLGDGAGGLSTPAIIPVLDSPMDVAIGDVTADGLPDLVIGHSTTQTPDVVSVLPGDGAGGFLPAQTWPAGDGNQYLAIGDVNADGAADLVLTELADSLTLLLGDAPGAFQAPRLHAAGGGSPTGLALADVDGDQLSDVLVLRIGLELKDGMVAVLRGLGAPEPWTNLGLGLAGSAGIPMLVGHGSLQPGEPASLTLHGAQPASAAFLVIGFQPLLAPFKGGVLVPRPHLIVGGLATDATGSLDLHADWPSGVPSALTVWYQLWIVDPGAAQGLAGSNGVTSSTP